MDTQSSLRPTQHVAVQGAVSAKPAAMQLPDWVTAADQHCPPLPTELEAGQSVLTIHETALLLRVSTRTVRRLVARREITVVRIGRSLRVTRDALDRFMSENDGSSFNSLYVCREYTEL